MRCICVWETSQKKTYFHFQAQDKTSQTRTAHICHSKGDEEY